MNDIRVNVKLDDGAVMPTKAHAADAGHDIYTPIEMTVPAYGSYTLDTGVHMIIPNGYVGFIKSKSGLNVRDGIRAEGVIDAGYTGSIVVKLYNDSGREKVFLAGDKVTQIVILPIPEVSLVQVDELEETDRGDNGFGSSGR